MHLKRVKVDQYGPIRDFDYDLEPSLHLFYGKNESGKTLLVESIIKLLLGDKDGPFDGIGRVGQPPNGFVILEDGENQFTLPDQGYDSVFSSTTPSDLQNAFIIRDFDLRVPRKSDFGRASYFREVTDRITGAQTQAIQSIREELQDIGFLTNSTSSARLLNQKPRKLKDSRKKAEDLAEEIQGYLEEIRTEGVLEKARRKRRLETDLDEIGHELDELEKAEEQARLDRARDLLKKLEGVQAKIDDLEDEESSKIDDFQNLQNRIQSHRQRRKEEPVSPAFYRYGTLVTVGLFALALIATIVTAGTISSGIAAVLLVAAAGFGYKYWNVWKLDKEARDIVDDAKHSGVSGDALADIDQTLEAEIESFEERKQSLNRDEASYLTQLQELFETEGESIDHWQTQIDSLEDQVGETEQEWNADRHEELVKRKQENSDKLDQLTEELNHHADKLSEFDRTVANLPLEQFTDVEEPRIESIVELEPTIERLNDFVSTLNTRVETAIGAIEILEEIEEEEVREINYLFEDDSYALEFFNECCDGNYDGIRYEEADNVVKVTRADGRELSADKLSQGTYDLLYLAIRLKLAQELLDGDPGFLILDDAFLHSDDDRINQEMDLLDELATEGWQILYFSIRNAVRDAVRDNPTAEIEELPPLEFTD